RSQGSWVRIPPSAPLFLPTGLAGHHSPLIQMIGILFQVACD
ncbi:uncharacterized protein METZ01_LOCUS397339, partial [marine metagenome]